MKSIYRWAANHPRFAKVIISVVITVFCFWALDPEIFSFFTRFLIVFLLLFNGYLFVNTIPEKLMREPLEILEQQCDPYPFLEEMERQMGLCQDNLQGQVTHINYAMALGQTGQYEKALGILEKINIDRFPVTSPFIKYIYYNNLCDTLTHLDRFVDAEIWHRKAAQIYADLPANKARQNLDYNSQMNEIEALYREGDYPAALRKLGWLTCKTQRSLMNAAFLAANCNLKLEEYDKAREKLQYVIDNGNKLYCVEKAKQLLSELP